MIIKQFIFLVISILFVFSCAPEPQVVEVNVSNNLVKARKSETIEIEISQLSTLLGNSPADQLIVKDAQTNQILLSQLIDLDGDKNPDQLIFQSGFGAGEQKHFHIAIKQEGEQIPTSEISTFARFVPERIDDFAWENDKVAFRTYGPKAQQLTESGSKGGTLSSGIDCWLKRVDYPIINKWYKQDLEEKKSYHKDHGEGLDNYHVGDSRGTGGIGIWKDGQLLTSKNYQSWKIITNGPIRTIFELDYGNWDAEGLPVKEIKRISIDLGENLYKNTLILGNYKELPNITLGVTLHEKVGEVATDKNSGWFRYMEPIDDSEISTAIVVDPSLVTEFIDHRVDEADLSNILVVCKPSAEVTYYAGFAWKKANQYSLPDGFDGYLANFSDRIASPLEVNVVAK